MYHLLLEAREGKTPSQCLLTWSIRADEPGCNARHASRSRRSTYAVDQPEIVPMRAVEACFSVSDRRSHRLFGVDECLRVHKVAA
jgi:hypothetical protein